MGLKGRLPNFIKSFLSDRKFWVYIGTTLSDIQNQEGVPQGSILSVTLFKIKIYSITNCLNPGIGKYLFVDDFCITSSSKYIRTAEHQLQQGINKINKWTIINGFTISKTKTQCVHFCQLRKMDNNPTLKLDWSEIPVVDQYKFLCVIFDKKLSFILHIQYLKDKCNKTLKQRLGCRSAHLAEAVLNINPLQDWLWLRNIWSSQKNLLQTIKYSSPWRIETRLGGF